MLKKVEEYLVSEGLIDIEPSGRKTVDVSHYSPDWLISAVREVMGAIDLDPASCRIAQKRIQASKYYTEGEVNGFTQDWEGRVYLNPNHDQTDLFVGKLLNQWSKGPMTECIVRVHTQEVYAEWFHVLLDIAEAVCFVKGEIEWVPAWAGYEKELEMLGLDWKSFPPYSQHGSLIAYLGPNKTKFVSYFEEFGTILVGEGND